MKVPETTQIAMFPVLCTFFVLFPDGKENPSFNASLTLVALLGVAQPFNEAKAVRVSGAEGHQANPRLARCWCDDPRAMLSLTSSSTEADLELISLQVISARLGFVLIFSPLFCRGFAALHRFGPLFQHGLLKH